MTTYTKFARRSPTTREIAEIAVVNDLATGVQQHLAASAAEIDRVHIHGAQSRALQAIVSRLLCGQLAFTEEVVITPDDGLVTSARPDFYRRLSPGRGVLAEVERGGTTTNNHDLKDLWKTHIAPDAQHLFLIIPNANWDATGAVREKPFPRAARRLAAFFGDPRREIDVLSLHPFGYGPTTVAPDHTHDPTEGTRAGHK